MPIVGHGWELLVTRLDVQQSDARVRTYDEYQVYREGQPAADLSGYMCECIGPGDLVKESGRRIPQGRYPLRTQFGKYRTIGYSTSTVIVADPHMPGIALANTEPRTGILIHPGHPPDLYLSSIGCLNPTKPLSTTDVMDFWDSRVKVIAFINDLKNFAPDAFATQTETSITNAWIVIDGEPPELVA